MPIMRRSHHSEQIMRSQMRNSICVKRNASFNEEEPTSIADIGMQHAFKILRSLPKYNIGDEIRKVDTILCHSKEATAFAMKRLRPNDCAFVMRSDGTFTYALYQGIDDKDSSRVSFQVSDRGHTKTLPQKLFCDKVKVPTLPAALLSKIPPSMYSDDSGTPDEEEKEAAPQKELGRVLLEAYTYRNSATLIRHHGQNLASQSAPQLARRISCLDQTIRPARRTIQRRASTEGVLLEGFAVRRRYRANKDPVSVAAPAC